MSGQHLFSIVLEHVVGLYLSGIAPELYAPSILRCLEHCEAAIKLCIASSVVIIAVCDL
jgi:hypothetical protein